mmetsp:Transcript_29581/g.32951  ORF Transcript_29581/g.32951 Transcript_29581/m.32951 type:complete len:316 (-) Transcript_29581:146-1093(-)
MYKRKSQKGNILLNMAAGGTSGGVARFVIAPLDVLKIRFQIQASQASASVKSAAKTIPQLGYHYAGMADGTRKIWRQEGITGFWKGNLIAQTYMMLGIGVQFCIYEMASTALQTSEWSPVGKVALPYLAGAFSGFTTVLVCYPMDLLRTRFAAQGEKKVYKTVLGAVRSIYRQEGMLGFYSGICPAMCRFVPYFALQFGVYKGVKGFLFNNSSHPVCHLASGAIAGSIGKFLTLPLDVTQKRLQVHGMVDYKNKKGYKKCPPTLATMQTIWAKEGIRGLYSGGAPAILKTSLSVAVTFAMYEYVTTALSTYSQLT